MKKTFELFNKEQNFLALRTYTLDVIIVLYFTDHII